MERFNLECLCEIEQKINENLGMLELTKAYCDMHMEKVSEFLPLSSIIEKILVNQRKLLQDIDSIV